MRLAETKFYSRCLRPVAGCWFMLAFWCLCPSSFALTPKVAISPVNTNFQVQTYVVEGKNYLSQASLKTLLAASIGTNVTRKELALAAGALQAEYARAGYPNISVAISEKQITNGTVSLYAFEAAKPQIFISGEIYLSSGEPLKAEPTPALSNNIPAANAVAEATNRGPRFSVTNYVVTGNTLLSTAALQATLDPHTGTNVGLKDIMSAGTELQKEYRDRGYPTVSVTIPPQQISNGLVKMRVFEGRLSEIRVAHNHYFSSNNVMRAMPGLHTNQILNGPIFQAELNRANANQDRQIYPKIEPGFEPNTTVLDLDVKDRLPLHGKVELNNESSPGTPELRVNTSAVYNNLWQQEHSFGVQYSFSPEVYKTGSQWNFYDLPVVANYSAFYRLPLGDVEPIEDAIASQPGTFGYSEATRQFRLPPPSGQADLTFFASRSTIDTRLNTISRENLFNTNGNSLDRQDLQQDITVNDDLGLRASLPLFAWGDNWQSTVSGGIDYKSYSLISAKTNVFTLNGQVIDQLGGTVVTNFNTSVDTSPVPTTYSHFKYLPLSARYDASEHDARGVTTFGTGLNFNPWYSGSVQELRAITGSSQSSGRWFVVTPTITRDINFYTNWVLSLHADGQFSTEPLISNEEFGAGGVASVRGYREGEVFGDNGWRVSGEQKTPPHVTGLVFKNHPLTLRGSVYMDYAQVYLIDPQTRPRETSLWGAGIGGAASIGANFEARFWFSLPLLNAGTTEAYQPFFNFSLTAQF